MPRTVILDPLDEGDKTPDVKENLRSINKLMYRFYKKKRSNVFDDILGILKLSEEEYFTTIRCGIQRKTVFLKRDSLSVGTSGYKIIILNLFQSNMDIQ